jgi:hypothetical protein
MGVGDADGDVFALGSKHRHGAGVQDVRVDRPVRSVPSQNLPDVCDSPEQSPLTRLRHTQDSTAHLFDLAVEDASVVAEDEEVELNPPPIYRSVEIHQHRLGSSHVHRADDVQNPGHGPRRHRSNTHLNVAV